MDLTLDNAAYIWLSSDDSTSCTPAHASYSLFWLIMDVQEVAMAVWASRHKISPCMIDSLLVPCHLNLISTPAEPFLYSLPFRGKVIREQ